MKYIAELNLDYDKKFCEQFISQSNLNLIELEKTQRWHNNVTVNDLLKTHFGSVTNYLKDVILVLTLFPNKQINIHADGAGTSYDNTYNVSINIPVRNCNNTTKTIFWDFSDESPIEYIHYEKLGTRDIVNKDRLVRAQEYIFKDKAVLFRNEYPHSVENQNNKLRVMLSWRFKSEYSWKDALEICNDLKLI